MRNIIVGNLIGLFLALMVLLPWLYVCNIISAEQRSLDMRLKHLEELIYDNKVEDPRIEIS